MVYVVIITIARISKAHPNGIISRSNHATHNVFTWLGWHNAHLNNAHLCNNCSSVNSRSQIMSFDAVREYSVCLSLALVSFNGLSLRLQPTSFFFFVPFEYRLAALWMCPRVRNYGHSFSFLLSGKCVSRHINCLS
jgi:hypothetical protein